MPHIKVTAHGSVPRDALQKARRITPQAAREVERRLGPLAPVRLILTTSEGIAQLAIDAETTLVPEVTGRAREKWLRLARRNAQNIYGHTLLAPSGGTLVLIHTAKCQARPGELATTILHELVHARQLSPASARADQLRYMRHEFGVAPLPRREVKAHARLIDQHEEEAHRLEAELAPYVGETNSR